jgi:hypothetical protein
MHLLFVFHVNYELKIHGTTRAWARTSH